MSSQTIPTPAQIVDWADIQPLDVVDLGFVQPGGLRIVTAIDSHVVRFAASIPGAAETSLPIFPGQRVTLTSQA